MAERTKGPWAVQHSGVAWDGIQILGAPGTADSQVLPNEPRLICDLLTGTTQDTADAEFIVRACNAYDDMMAALELVAEELDDECRNLSNGAVHLSNPAKDAVAAALAKVKGAS